MIDPGQMRTKIVYQTNTPVQNSGGQPIESWSDVVTIWAKVEPLSGREAWYANQINASVSHRVTFRYHPGVAPTGRFKLGIDRVLNITSITDFEERRIEMTALCTEAIGD